MTYYSYHPEMSDDDAPPPGVRGPFLVQRLNAVLYAPAQSPAHLLAHPHSYPVGYDAIGYGREYVGGYIPDYSAPADIGSQAQPELSTLDQILTSYNAENARQSAAESAHMAACDPTGYAELQRLEARFSASYQRGYNMPSVYAKGLFS